MIQERNNEQRIIELNKDGVPASLISPSNSSAAIWSDRNLTGEERWRDMKVANALCTEREQTVKKLGWDPALERKEVVELICKSEEKVASFPLPELAEEEEAMVRFCRRKKVE